MNSTEKITLVRQLHSQFCSVFKRSLRGKCEVKSFSFLALVYLVKESPDSLHVFSDLFADFEFSLFFFFFFLFFELTDE